MSNLAKWRKNPCPTCKAKPGAYCTSGVGTPASTWVHTARKNNGRHRVMRRSSQMPEIKIVPVTSSVETPSIAAQLAAEALQIVSANNAVFLVTLEKQNIRIDASRTPEGIIDIRVGGLPVTKTA